MATMLAGDRGCVVKLKVLFVGMAKELTKACSWPSVPGARSLRPEKSR